MNTRCRVCLHTELEDRKDIDSRLVYGESYASILKDYPHLNRYVLLHHKKHMADPKNEADVAAQLMARQIAKARMADFNVEQFICDLRERLKFSINQSQCLIEEFTEDVQDGTRSISDLNDVIAAQQKLLSNLDNIAAIKILTSDEAAYTKVLKDGNTILSPASNTEPRKLSFAEFKSSTNGTTNPNDN